MRSFLLAALLIIAIHVSNTLCMDQWGRKKHILPLGDVTELSRNDKDSIIQQALNSELLPTNTIVLTETSQPSQEALQKLLKDRCEEAINITLWALNQFPQNFALQYKLALLLDEGSPVSPSPLKEAMVERSAQLFNKLFEESVHQPKSEMYPFQSEYYYRCGKYYEQYILGCHRENYYQKTTDEWAGVGFRSYYSQGMGASNHARQQPLEKKDRQTASMYAHKAVIAWEKYFFYKDEYYKPYVNYALALAILGHKKKMMQALQRSAQLIQADLDYREFQEIIKFAEHAEKLMNERV